MSYQTKERVAILECLASSADLTMTAEDIKNVLVKSGLCPNQATIYRNLQRLSDDGLILKFPMENGHKSCYQFAQEHKTACHEHLHLKCSDCGKVIHLDCSFMEQLTEHIRIEHGFTMNFDNSVINGLCDECIKKKNRSFVK